MKVRLVQSVDVEVGRQVVQLVVAGEMQSLQNGAIGLIKLSFHI